MFALVCPGLCIECAGKRQVLGCVHISILYDFLCLYDNYSYTYVRTYTYIKERICNDVKSASVSHGKYNSNNAEV